MSKARTALGIVAVVTLSVVALSLSGVAAKDAEPPGYSFVVTYSDSEIVLSCQDNCAWLTLRYSCGEAPCSVVVDFEGIRTATSRDVSTKPKSAV